MAYFSNETIAFLKQLEKNNNRDWFNAHKQDYLDHVKNPFETFIGDLIEAMSVHFESLPITPKDAIFRIYRDVRFSKDKSPYKTKISALVSPGGRKNRTMPGIYLEFSPNDMRIYSGLYALETKELYNLRSHISHNLKAFDELIHNDAFVKEFGEIRGEKNKRIPQEFEDDAQHQPLMYNKQFYFFTSWPKETILKDNVIEKITETYLIAKPISDFLYEGIF